MNRYLVTALTLVLSVGPAAAQNDPFCEELWLSRNTVLDRAGQCFATPLGQAVFDNAGCVAGDTRLNPLDAEIVRVAEAVETWAGCAVDTEAGGLSVQAMTFRARLTELFTVPVRIDTEAGCVNYQGPPVPLHAGISTNLTVIGMIEPGQTVLAAHQALRGGWQYLQVFAADGRFAHHGWAQGLNGDPDMICGG